MSGAITYDFSGRVVVITGGGRGLGRAIAEAFVNAGATVVIIGRDAARLEAAAAELSASGHGRVHAYAADVTDEAVLADAADAVETAHGAAHILINNAGVNPWYKKAENTSLEEWRTIIDTNLTSAFHCCLLFGKPMLERKSGSIISISSVAGHVGLARSAAYNAAKGGIELMTKSLAIDWADRNVRVNTVAPGYFATDLTAGLQASSGLSSKVMAHTPLGRFGAPNEITGACLFLASDAASYITGQSLRVDGGFSAC